MAKEHALDIFHVLGQLDRKNFDLWDQLTEEQRKEVSPYVLLRWLSGCDEPEQQVKLGEIACACLFEFGSKPELMLYVLAACTAGGAKRYRWQNPKSASKTSSKALELVMKEHDMPKRHAVEALPLFTSDDLLELAEKHGYQPDELKQLKKELA